MKMKSFRGKMIFFYLILSLLNISFFSVIIFENQIELIAKNTIMDQKEITRRIVDNIHVLFIKDRSQSGGSFKDYLSKTKEFFKGHINSFIIITAQGEKVLSENYDKIPNDYELGKSIRALTAKEFSGDLFYSEVDKEERSIKFYIPLANDFKSDLVLIYSKNLNIISESMMNLYWEIFTVILIIFLFHLAVGFIFFRFFIRPISLLHKQSRLLSGGSYNARVKIQSNDEIGELAESFNLMAQSIEGNIDRLEHYKLSIEDELAMAGEVQKLIFPVLSDTDKFIFSIFSMPYGKVSGDYYDFLELEDKSHAIFISDVSGHGVPAALMTMNLKENFERYARVHTEPSLFFRILNTRLCSMWSMGDVTPRFFSGIYMLIDDKNNAVFCNAGHPEPYLIKNGSNEIIAFNSGGGLVGIFNDMNPSFSSESLMLERGDRILFLTDGIHESRNIEEQQYGIHNIIKSIKTVRHLGISVIVEKIVSDLKLFIDLEDLSDDATIFGFEIK